jgi:nucleotide-binding universal stress UspA family protein
MSFKDVQAIVLSDADESVVVLADAVAGVQGGIASALLFEVEPEPIYVEGMGLGAATGLAWSEVTARAHESFLKEKAKVEVMLSRFGNRIPLRCVSVGAAALGPRAGVEARYADVTVLARPRAELDGARIVTIEGALFGSGRPIILAPPDWKSGKVGEIIAIAWNAKREAARAVAAASPLLDRAKKVVILTVDAKPSPKGHGEAPGADMAAHLARRGTSVEVRNVDGLGRKEGDALLQECQAFGADVLVLGGYGHSRLQEYVLGGVTRDLLHASPIPLLMAH